MGAIECRKIKQILLLICLICVCLSDSPTKCIKYDKVAQEAIFVNLTDPTNYKKWMRPYSESHVLVNVSIEMYSMASVNERDSEFNINLLIDLEWTDSRLAVKDSICKPIEDLTIEGSEWHLDRIWSPKLRVPNNKNPSALDRDAKIILLRVASNGYVRVRKRLNLDLYCQMDFRYYPLDSQSCPLVFISSDLSVEHLTLEWTHPEGEAFTSNNNFYMTGFALQSCDLDSGSTITKNEHFSSVAVTFRLEREWAHFILGVYLPTFLVIIVSWITFWMDITETPARITLGITTMLTFLTVAKDSREDLPNVPYVNALDIWFVICTGFIFMSLIEFAVITYISRAEKRKLKQMKSLRRNISQSQMSLETHNSYNSSDGLILRTPQLTKTRFNFDPIEIKLPKSPNLSQRFTLAPMSPPAKRVKLTITPPDSPNPDSIRSECNYDPMKRTPVEIAEAIDRKCRYIFPILFIIFNIFYWSLLLYK